MAIAFRATGHASESAVNDTSWSITAPTGTATGDVVICGMCVIDGVGTPTAPTGWTTLRSGNVGSVLGYIICWRAIVGGDPSSWTDGVRTGGTTSAWHSYANGYTGVHTTTPIVADAAPTTAISGSTLAGPTVNNTGAGTEWRVSFYGRYDEGGIVQTSVTRLTNGSGAIETERGDAGSAPSGDMALATADSNATVATGNQNTFNTWSGAVTAAFGWMGYIKVAAAATSIPNKGYNYDNAAITRAHYW